MQFLRTNIGRTTCVSFPRHVSRVCLTSGSTHSQGKHANEETYNTYNADEAISYVGDESAELQRSTKDNRREAREGISDGEAEKMKDKANKKVDKTSDQIKHMKDKAKENAYNIKENTEDTMDVLEAAAEKTKKTAKEAWETTKDATRKIKETVVGTSSFNVDDVWENHTGKPKIKDKDRMNSSK